MSEWISVDDRLPDPGQEVLLHICLDRNHGGFYVEANEMITGGYEIDENGRDWFVGNRSIIWDYHFNLSFVEDDITHWMPLPPPPLSENEKGLNELSRLSQEIGMEL